MGNSLNSIKSIAVFCGSSLGTKEIYRTTALEVGELLAKRSISIIYGGARIGLMGAVADGSINHGGEVIGVIPTFLKSKEIAHEGLKRLIEVKTMHERKTKMNGLCDAVIALPGGFGTFEEFLEMTTWAQLGLHQKPVGLLNVNGYYNAFLEMIEMMQLEGFLKAKNAKMILSSTNIEDLLSQMENYNPPEVEKWISTGKT